MMVWARHDRATVIERTEFADESKVKDELNVGRK